MVPGAGTALAPLRQPHGARRSQPFAGQLAGLLDPIAELIFVEAILVDVEVADFPVLGFAGWEWSQRRTAEESHFHVFRKAMKAEEPTLALHAIEGRVPFDCLAHSGDGARDDLVKAAPKIAFPVRHGRDVGLHGGVAVSLGDLRVAA